MPASKKPPQHPAESGGPGGTGGTLWHVVDEGRLRIRAVTYRMRLLRSSPAYFSFSMSFFSSFTSTFFM